MDSAQLGVLIGVFLGTFTVSLFFVVIWFFVSRLWKVKTNTAYKIAYPVAFFAAFLNDGSFPRVFYFTACMLCAILIFARHLIWLKGQKPQKTL